METEIEKMSNNRFAVHLVALLIVACALFSGDPDLIDALISNLMVTKDIK